MPVILNSSPVLNAMKSPIYNIGLTTYLYFFIAGIIIFTVQGFAKALISSKLGDPLPKRDGRLTLNPFKHIEPIGMFLMIVYGFGWGKPVETASIYYANRKTGTLLTYTAPSLIYLLIGFLISPFLNYNIGGIANIPYLSEFLFVLAFSAIRNAIFNLIPVYPLDGAKILSVLRNPNAAIMQIRTEKIIQLILVFLVFGGLFGTIIDPICKIFLFGF